MWFDATPINMTELLVVCLAIVSLIMLMKKRYDTNLPILFYSVAVTFTNTFDRPINPYIMYGSLAFALLLRFEFMNTTFAKAVAFLTGVGLCMVIYAMVSDVMA
jgi:hypothetical protein